MILGLSYYQLFELVTGAFIIWVGFYLISKNPFSTLSWIVFLFILGVGFCLFVDPILQKTPTLYEYIKWQKITDWTLFFSPIFYFHVGLLTIREYNKKYKIILIVGYVFAVIIYLIDIHGGLILKEGLNQYENFRRINGFYPGVLLIPAIGFECIYLLLGTLLFYSQIKKDFKRYFLLFLAGLLMLSLGIFVIVSFYITAPYADRLFTFAWFLSSFLFIYPILRYHLFLPPEKVIFDRNFYYKTIYIFTLIVIYLLVIPFSGLKYSYNVLILSDSLIFLVLLTHSSYEWLSTFLNDLVYNPSSGLSIVNDVEICTALKNYNSPSVLENSSLLRLDIVHKKMRDNVLPVDALRGIINDTVEYFKPKDQINHRVKSNLKYQLLKMVAFDEAEEGQILWELGFMEYPTRIISIEKVGREPMFFTESASDYSYTSRNAYLALKKEAIHDVAWRISYLEKMSKKLRGLI